MMQDLLGPEPVGRRGWFEPTEVTRRVSEHLAGTHNHAHQLFSLMVLERWAQSFLD
jgi:asparagine synthase (glutamine-hydrolysing)